MQKYYLTYGKEASFSGRNSHHPRHEFQVTTEKYLQGVIIDEYFISLPHLLLNNRSERDRGNSLNLKSKEVYQHLINITRCNKTSLILPVPSVMQSFSSCVKWGQVAHN
jgi:hypothetical protein